MSAARMLLSKVCMEHGAPDGGQVAANVPHQLVRLGEVARRQHKHRVHRRHLFTIMIELLVCQLLHLSMQPGVSGSHAASASSRPAPEPQQTTAIDFGNVQT